MEKVSTAPANSALSTHIMGSLQHQQVKAKIKEGLRT
jgi:hypothetical protein